MISSAAVASTAIVVGGWKATHASPETPHTLSVVGEARQHVTPDKLTWTITVHGREPDRDTAVSDLHDAVDKVHTYLTSHGLKEAELAFKPASVDQDTNDTTNSDGDTTSEPGDFDASQEIDVTSTDVARALKAYRDAQLAEDMTGTDQEEPDCTVSGIASLEKQLTTAARHDARAKAEATLADYGAHVGKLVEADAAGFDSGTTGVDGCAGADATATAHAVFEID
ncbi:MAG: SIMPL domain-containing protein [Acidobacteriota bacterium]